jgi:hypothetical protein
MAFHPLADHEGAMKAFLRTQNVGGEVGNRVFLGMPEEGPSAWPVITLFRMGGGPDDGDYLMDTARMAFHVWGVKGQKTECFAVAQALISILYYLPAGTMLDENTRALGVSGLASVWSPEPEDGRARYVVTGVVQAQAIGP